MSRSSSRPRATKAFHRAVPGVAEKARSLGSPPLTFRGFTAYRSGAGRATARLTGVRTLSFVNDTKDSDMSWRRRSLGGCGCQNSINKTLVLRSKLKSIGKWRKVFLWILNIWTSVLQCVIGQKQAFGRAEPKDSSSFVFFRAVPSRARARVNQDGSLARAGIRC